MHCEINDLVHEYIDGQDNVDIAELAARMAESLAFGSDQTDGPNSSCSTCRDVHGQTGQPRSSEHRRAPSAAKRRGKGAMQRG